jgi:threonine/homoserine/homoserine lactone efflux protein
MTIFGLSLERLGVFAFAVALLALTPGPVWIYLISRTLAQGRRAGYFSLIGVMPGAFDAIKLAGAAYLLWLAWSTVRGAGFSFTPQPLDPVPDRVLFRQSLTASVVNPKVAVFYLSLFPQFVDPTAGHVLLQSLGLGAVHVAVSTVIDGLVRAPAGLAEDAALASGRCLRRARSVAGVEQAQRARGLSPLELAAQPFPRPHRARPARRRSAASCAIRTRRRSSLPAAGGRIGVAAPGPSP